MQFDEDGFLSTFDLNRNLIYAIAAQDPAKKFGLATGRRRIGIDCHS